MKVKEREAWLLTNLGKGGQRPSYDPYNKSFKGKERNPAAKEFASQDVEEYHHYSERAEHKYDSKDNKTAVEKKNNTDKKSIVKSVVGRVAAVAVSSVVIVSTYSTMTIVQSENWIWSGDHSTVTVELIRPDGKVLRELPAAIDILVDNPTCNQTGLITYTATAEDENGDIYTNIQYEELAPLGHDHHIVNETNEDGQIVRTYECDRCHETFTITINIDERD